MPSTRAALLLVLLLALLMAWLPPSLAEDVRDEPTAAPKHVAIRPCAGERREGKNMTAAIVLMDCLVPERRAHDRSSIFDVVRIAKLFNPHTPIVLATASRTAAEQELLCDLGVTLRACAHYMDTPAEENFTKVYRHSSVNLYGKELFCFVRFMMLQKLVREEGLTHIVFADADILLLSDALAELQLAEGMLLRALFYTTTYYSMWTPKALDAFVDFMLGFYLVGPHRTQADIEADIRKHGKQSRKSDEPGFIAQFSDMQMFAAFQHANIVPNTVDFPNVHEAIRSHLFEFTAVISLRVAFSNPRICVEPWEQFLANFVWADRRIEALNLTLREPLPRPQSERSFLGVHFQSPPCKTLLHDFAHAIVPLETQLKAMREHK
jgi:hypothetical protein